MDAWTKTHGYGVEDKVLGYLSVTFNAQDPRLLEDKAGIVAYAIPKSCQSFYSRNYRYNIQVKLLHRKKNCIQDTLQCHLYYS